MANVELDKPASYTALDSQNVLSRIVEQPEQYLESWNQAVDFRLPRTYRFARNVAFLGMGGSAIGADVVRVLMQEAAPVPAQVVRDYDLPGWCDNRTLVVACSYSGGTEETLSATRQAIERGCKLLAVTSGGVLGELAAEHGFPAYPIDYASEPRSALAHTLTPPLVFMQQLGFLEDLSAQFSEATAICAALRDRLEPAVAEATNPAKQLARELHHRIPVVIGGGFLAVVAARWKTQLNENAKTWAIADVLPELNHNTVVGLPGPAGSERHLHAVWLQSPLLHPRTQARYQITQGLFDSAGIAGSHVDGRGSSSLAHALSVILFGDFVSYYLAMLNGVDPFEIDNIVYLKGRLAALEA